MVSVTDLQDTTDEDSFNNGNPESISEKQFKNAEEELPEFRKQLLEFRDEMSNVAEMYQQDYIDKVELRSDLTKEARDRAVTCLVDVSKRIYNLAGCFQQLLDDQADKLSDIENKALTATASLEKTTCLNFRAELYSRLPPANVPNRQPRIGRPPDIVQPDGTVGSWGKLNYKKYDRVTLVPPEEDEFDEDFYEDMSPAVPTTTTTSQLSLSSGTSATLHSPQIANQPRLSASSVDIRQGSMSPALNRCNSSTSLTSLTSSKSLRLQPTRAAPAPPPGTKMDPRQRLHSVKNETGEGLHKPSIPAPRPPPVNEHYAVPPPSSRMSTLDEGNQEPIYDAVKAGGAVPPPAPPVPQIQYQTLSVQPVEEEEEFYTDMGSSTLVPKAPPSPIGPPPPPAPEEEEDIYDDVDNIYDAPSLREPPEDPLYRPASSTSDRTVVGDPAVGDPAVVLMVTPPEDDGLYADHDMDVLPPPPDDDLPPPPPDDLPPDDLPPPMPEYEGEYADQEILGGVQAVQGVSVSKDSGFETDQDIDEPIIERARALYEYAASASDELDLGIGDVVTVYVKNDDGWYEGTLNGKRGLFPGNYVETI